MPRTSTLRIPSRTSTDSLALAKSYVQAVLQLQRLPLERVERFPRRPRLVRAVVRGAVGHCICPTFPSRPVYPESSGWPARTLAPPPSPTRRGSGAARRPSNPHAHRPKHRPSSVEPTSARRFMAEARDLRLESRASSTKL